jgi:hypothetical protein
MPKPQETVAFLGVNELWIFQNRSSQSSECVSSSLVEQFAPTLQPCLCPIFYCLLPIAY